MVGIATLTMVVSSSAMNAPASSTANASQLLRVATADFEVSTVVVNVVPSWRVRRR